MIAVLGLAHSFGAGRALIDRYESARAASALAGGRIEALAAVASRNPSDPSLSIGAHGPGAVALSDNQGGQVSWLVEWVDDPLDGLAGADPDSPDDYKRVTVAITWTQGAVTDTVKLTRILQVY